MAVVSPTKMNVFYYGVPNPIDISVPGFSPEDLQVSGTGVSIKKLNQVSTKLQYSKKIVKKPRLL